MATEIGLFGLIIILIGWIIETIESIRTGESKLPVYFIVTYGIGSLFLAIQNFITNGEITATILISSTTVLVIIQILYLVGRRSKRKR